MKRLICALVGHHWDVYSWVRYEKYTGRITSGRRCARCDFRTTEFDDLPYRLL